MTRLSALLFASISLGVAAQNINQVGFTFTPAELTVDAGEEITITFNANHTVTEVSEATWNSNGNTSNGGFNFTGGGTQTLVLDEAGTYYYVCIFHAGMGMKGKIIVNSGNGIEAIGTTPMLSLFPNPASTEVSVSAAEAGQLITVLDASGRQVIHRVVNGMERLDLSGMEPGNYMVLLTGSDRKVLARERLTIAR